MGFLHPRRSYLTLMWAKPGLDVQESGSGRKRTIKGC